MASVEIKEVITRSVVMTLDADEAQLIFELAGQHPGAAQISQAPARRIYDALRAAGAKHSPHF